ncbi:hypothetical protein MJO29_001550 [Puccinia striiformis f. sp. tritici]|uniref:Uncharacterized protein n=1 Tax=Puccinia striiformis TaxID=27350 RepID=A0A2S4W399_9BASI|nr:hypothetical protein MJO29_001550 [Puccinia striiformis f. sp. tritici]POW16250.1 hypothetical protein PSTT_01533 [Puccinia striiformis]
MTDDSYRLQNNRSSLNYSPASINLTTTTTPNSPALNPPPLADPGVTTLLLGLQMDDPDRDVVANHESNGQSKEANADSSKSDPSSKPTHPYSRSISWSPNGSRFCLGDPARALWIDWGGISDLTGPGVSKWSPEHRRSKPSVTASITPFAKGKERESVSEVNIHPNNKRKFPATSRVTSIAPEASTSAPVVQDGPYPFGVDSVSVDALSYAYMCETPLLQRFHKHINTRLHKLTQLVNTTKDALPPPPFLVQ